MDSTCAAIQSAQSQVVVAGTGGSIGRPPIVSCAMAAGDPCTPALAFIVECAKLFCWTLFLGRGMCKCPDFDVYLNTGAAVVLAQLFDTNSNTVIMIPRSSCCICAGGRKFGCVRVLSCASLKAQPNFIALASKPNLHVACPIDFGPRHRTERGQVTNSVPLSNGFEPNSVTCPPNFHICDLLRLVGFNSLPTLGEAFRSSYGIAIPADQVFATVHHSVSDDMLGILEVLHRYRSQHPLVVGSGDWLPAAVDGPHDLSTCHVDRGMRHLLFNQHDRGNSLPWSETGSVGMRPLHCTAHSLSEVVTDHGELQAIATWLALILSNKYL